MDVSIINFGDPQLEAVDTTTSLQKFINKGKTAPRKTIEESVKHIFSKAQVEVEYSILNITDIHFTRLLHKFRKRYPDATNSITTDTNLLITLDRIRDLNPLIPRAVIPTNITSRPIKYTLRKITDIADPKNGTTYLFKVLYYSKAMERHDLSLNISYEVPLSDVQLDNIFNEGKTYTRHKNRWSFGIEGKYRIDFTTTSNEDYDPFSDSTIIKTTREIEVELLSNSSISLKDFCTDEVIASFYNTILLTRTTYRRDEKETIMNMLRGVTTQKPIIMTVDDFLTPDPCIYASTKVDGMRKFLVVAKTGLYLVDPYPHTFINKIVVRPFGVDKESERQGRDIEQKIPGEHFDDYHGMILDGELVKVKKDGITGKKRYYYVAFDIVKTANSSGSLIQEDIEDRLGRVAAMSRIFEQVHFKIVRSHLHSYSITGSFEDYSRSVVIRKIQAMSHQTFYKTDGIVFRSSDGSVIRKYKPPQMLSIDLLVKTNWRRDSILSLQCSDQEFSKIITQDNSTIFTDKGTFLKQSINVDLMNLPLPEIVVEFVWKGGSIFSPARYRYDKITPNTLYTAERYLETIYRYPKGLGYKDIAGHSDLLLQHHITNHLVEQSKGLGEVIILGEYFSNFPILKSYKGTLPFVHEKEMERTSLLESKYPQGVDMLICVVNLDETLLKVVQRAVNAILNKGGYLLLVTMDKLAVDAAMMYGLIKEMELTEFIIRNNEDHYNIRGDNYKLLDCNEVIRKLRQENGLTATNSGYFGQLPTLPLEMQLKGRLIRWLKLQK